MGDDLATFLPDVVLCDLDGTLALFGNADPYNRDFTKDELNDAVNHILWRFNQAGTAIVLLSGRKKKYQEQTELWIDAHTIPPIEALYMRRNDDNRKDVIVKEEIYNEHIKDKYRVRAVFDDRLQVCRLWYRLGLPLFRVGDPDATG